MASTQMMESKREVSRSIWPSLSLCQIYAQEIRGEIHRDVENTENGIHVEEGAIPETMDNVTDTEAERAGAGAMNKVSHLEVESRYPSALMSILRSLVKATAASTPIN